MAIAANKNRVKFRNIVKLSQLLHDLWPMKFKSRHRMWKTLDWTRMRQIWRWGTLRQIWEWGRFKNGAYWGRFENEEDWGRFWAWSRMLWILEGTRMKIHQEKMIRHITSSSTNQRLREYDIIKKILCYPFSPLYPLLIALTWRCFSWYGVDTALYNRV